MIIDNIIIAHLNLDFCRFFVKFYESLRKIFQFIAKKAAAFGQEILSIKNGFLAGKIPHQKAIRTLLFCFVCSLLEQDMVLHHDLTAGDDGVHRQILVHQQQVRIHAGRDVALFAFNLIVWVVELAHGIKSFAAARKIVLSRMKNHSQEIGNPLATDVLSP